jgi:hypothetical protein
MSVACSGLANEPAKVRNRSQVPEFVGIQDPPDGLHPTVGDIERGDDEDAAGVVADDGPRLTVDPSADLTRTSTARNGRVKPTRDRATRPLP